MDAIDRLMQTLGSFLAEQNWNFIDKELLLMAGKPVAEGQEVKAEDANDYKTAHEMLEKTMRRTFPGFDLACLALLAEEESEDVLDDAEKEGKEACQTS